MNIVKNLILLKGEDKTENISSCQYFEKKYHIKFKNNNKEFLYNYNSVKWLRKPEIIDLNLIELYKDGNKLNDIENALKFDNYIRIIYKNKYTKMYPINQLNIKQSALSDSISTNVMKYYNELAKYISLRTDEGIALMQKKYEKLKFVDSNSVLATYLNPKLYSNKQYISRDLIFPFGSNLSQKNAVERAMTNKISVIEGPPGTGKTQTILNIISNALMQDMTIAVVSNNNSATMNVVEKLSDYQLDFVTAFLGNSENKKRFIDEQKKEVENLTRLGDLEVRELKENIKRINLDIEKMLRLRNDEAVINQDIKDLELEKQHFLRYFNENCSEIYSSVKDKNYSSKKLFQLWLKMESEHKKNRKIKLSIIQRFIAYFLKMGSWEFLKEPIENIISILQFKYYEAKHQELNIEKRKISKILKKFDYDTQMKNLTNLSMKLLKGKFAAKYNDKIRSEFVLDDLWKNSQDVVNEYPIILSTTYSITSSLDKSFIYDYVIVDEASQVDLITGVLAMSCAKNMVIVGDRMQLPNVIPKHDSDIAKQILSKYKLDKNYEYHNHSLLTSVIETIPEVKKTLLKEHYRCHPKIIQFCNQKFYNNNLIIMTEDKGENDVLKVYKTAVGNHARGHFNQRQIDEIKENIIPELSKHVNCSEIGIISPYRDQKTKLSIDLKETEIEIDTVHKFQGREKDSIIITTVDNEITEFTDNPNLLNVAISRAKQRIRLIVSDNNSNENTNVGDFVRYISYNNFEVVEGEVYSIFDLLYKEYTKQRFEYLKTTKKISQYDSENLMYKLLLELLKKPQFYSLDFINHLPLSMLVRNLEKLNEEETKYVMNKGTHTDFLIYRKVDKSPYLVIEVDGYKFHKEGTRQYERDQMKDSILEKYNIPILRLSTTGSNERKIITNKIYDLQEKKWKKDVLQE